MEMAAQSRRNPQGPRHQHQQPMQILGRLEEFDPTTDTVAAYEERTEIFFSVNGIPEEKKMAVFVNALGKSQYQLLKNLFAPTPPVRLTLEEIVSTLKGHYEPKQPVIAKRFNFHRCQQEKDETIAQYVTELRKLTVNCDFGMWEGWSYRTCLLE